MWELLIKAITDKNELEALKLINLVKSEDFIKNWETMPWDKIPSHLAAHHNLETILNALILKNPLLLMKVDSCNVTALHLATMNGNTSIVDMILKVAPESVNIKDKFGNTALHYAIYNEAITSKILSINPDLVNIANNEGQIAINFAMITNFLRHEPTDNSKTFDTIRYGRCEVIVNKLLSIMKENELKIITQKNEILIGDQNEDKWFSESTFNFSMPIDLPQEKILGEESIEEWFSESTFNLLK